MPILFAFNQVKMSGFKTYKILIRVGISADMEYDMKEFRERLRDLRRCAELTQKQLAKIIKTNNSSICDWECGRSEPDLRTLTIIASFFDVSTDYLLGLENESGSKVKLDLSEYIDY